MGLGSRGFMYIYICISCTLGSYAGNRYVNVEECVILVYVGPYPTPCYCIRFISGLFYMV